MTDKTSYARQGVTKLHTGQVVPEQGLKGGEEVSPADISMGIAHANALRREGGARLRTFQEGEGLW